ncbi:5-(carboxyamino)imidazole ribonucleotide mutase [candidate division KSB1 bacterium]|nr:5-(carboxyamino)imidazole ribonucleotide mutase [candidate division KSB1 bacterium]NIR72810.1 5-(carboxyamino)imidazole ribonucleotide mutase [candidate division KSB1 bacterium]NIS26850.1 5-(carboxyamino)imidazole ribonucleotide mutase [candidate division KSB1 bacterium]NIT73646.1 5-(carboxyamino)imidazole ribonucleotide mutase [candidate division KSB1 bacterium]NIU27517.1 5-(carboxyamino)imidazole ribonucleotide mutase [candidate division KSB1 bacterium]
MTSKKDTPVAIVLGSKSDRTVMAECKKILNHFKIGFSESILSAHRTPRETADFAENAEANGYRVIIAAAGMAAHLPGVLASYTTLPVIGVPMGGSSLSGLDSLYSIVQMPSGVPVATMAIGAAGAANAAIFAAKILSLQDSALQERLHEFKKQGCRI